VGRRGIGSHNITQTDLHLELLLPQLPEYWDYRYTPPCLAIVMQKIIRGVFKIWDKFLISEGHIKREHNFN
jgi:hypothetical protein